MIDKSRYLEVCLKIMTFTAQNLNSMRNIFTTLFIAFSSLFASSQSNIDFSADPAEIKIIKGQKHYDKDFQRELRQDPAWQAFLQEHGTWYVHFNEENQLPHRAYGQPIIVAGNTAEERALSFIQNELPMFELPIQEVVLDKVVPADQLTFVNFRQQYQGLQVLNSRLVVKLFEDKVILFGADIFNIADLNPNPTISIDAAASAAAQGIQNAIILITPQSELKVLPIPVYRNYEFHLVYEVMVKTRSESGVPANYQVFVDAHNGQILSRTNTVKHHHGPGKNCNTKCEEEQPPLTVSGTIYGEVYPTHPYNPTESLPLPNIEFTILGNTYNADENGDFSVAVNGPTQIQVRLQGLWSKVETNGTTPVMVAQVQEGSNSVQWSDLNSNVKERSAYFHVNVIHDHHRAYMPFFDGMDIDLTTNVDVAGECNAFYDGASINFFDQGGGCNASSLLGDVVYHEYGHGINDLYYQSLGSFFNNGAMGEGYADFWGISVTGNPVMGIGFYTDTQDGIRVYNAAPKVYPQDLVGEVHADGEIIMGAWYDTHLLMGGDWDQTIALFVEAYAGLQAEAANGDEGAAFTDVLLDVLQADDDDGDLSNGTPNGDAIIEGFDIHGITLLSNAELYHNDLEAAVESEDIEINATLSLEFPFDQYLDGVSLMYRLNDQAVWNEIEMQPNGGDNYQGIIPAQPKGTLIAYYVGVRDINDVLSNVQPVASALEVYPNLPYFILVGMEVAGVHDCDDNEDWGAWNPTVAGDNAGTGLWVFEEPVGSYTDEGAMVQVEFQHTPGGEYCFVTGNAGPGEGIGTNDVDDGKTTLETSEIDMTDYENPIVTYWRYYTNSPPGGANPGADWWQVRLSDDGGATWQYIENNMTDDMSWRRNAFRLLDYADATDEVKLQFIASDSTHIGQNLDGGSLIEAAVDDFIVYDEIDENSVNENEANLTLNLFPNPSSNITWIDFSLVNGSKVKLDLFNYLGECVWSSTEEYVARGSHRRKIALGSLASGMYLVKLSTETTVATSKLTVR